MSRKLCVIVSLLTALITIINIIFIIKDSFYYKIEDLPQGNLVREDFDQNILFSTGNKLKVYEVPETDHHTSAIRVELCNDNTGESKTVYWQIGTLSTVISWSSENDSVVFINDVPIDYSNPKTFYDCRDYENFQYKVKQTLPN